MKHSVVCAALIALLIASCVISTSASNNPNSPDPSFITIMPHVISMSSNTTWCTVNTNIPYGAVNTRSLALSGIPVAWTKSDLRGQLVAKFRMSEVKGIVYAPSTTLTLTGALKDGTPILGSDTVKVVE